MRALLIAGVAMLLINPYLLVYDPGFQLSFLATLGLIVLAPFIESKLHLVPTTFQAREFLTATVTTQLFVLPLLLFQIGAFSVVSVIVNVLVLPMVPVAMFFTFVAGVGGMLVTELGILLGFVAHLSLSYIILIAKLFSGLPFAAVTVPSFPLWVMAVAYGGMAYVIFLINERKKDPLADLRADSEGNLSDWTIEEETDLGVQSAAKSKNSFPLR
jgi:competence protein ComEC